jgi:Ca2+/Na+ antiporter
MRWLTPSVNLTRIAIVNPIAIDTTINALPSTKHSLCAFTVLLPSIESLGLSPSTMSFFLLFLSLFYIYLFRRLSENRQNNEQQHYSYEWNGAF